MKETRRHSNLERAGIHKLSYFIEFELGWICREQPLVDVGIDVLIESSKNGNPEGKFIACQVKSGEGNFYVNKGGFTYYISNVHYYYWTNLEIPILLIFFEPKLEKLYWIEIKKKNIDKTNKGWKITIPKSNLIELVPFREEVEAIIQINARNKELIPGILDETIDDILEDAEYTRLANESMLNMTRHLESYTNDTNKITDKVLPLTKKGLSIHNKKVRPLLNKVASTLNIFSSRMEPEIDIFSESFVKAVIAYRKIYFIQFMNLKTQLEEDVLSIKNLEFLIPKFNYVISTMQILYDSIVAFDNYNAEVKKAKTKALAAIEKLIIEVGDSVTLCQEIIDDINRSFPEGKE